MMEILAPGIAASVQDAGRPGWLHLGVGQAGAMDATALQVGNLLVGNAPGLAGVEFTLGGFALRFAADTVFALTGADAGARLDGDPVPAWWVRRARAGQELRAGIATRGMRSLLCVAGGIAVPPMLGSRATDLKGGFGGLDGRLLAAGDRLAVGDGAAPAIPDRGFGLDVTRLGLLDPPAGPVTVRFLPAAEWALLPPDMRDSLTAQDWRLRPDSNRMGYRLEGSALRLDRPVELLSHGILPGTLQLPPDGQPVIQMNDANTCGGYPKLGVVIGADMPRLAQLRLGAPLRLVPVDRATALAAAADRRAICDRLPARIALACDYAKRWGRQ